MIYMFEKKKRLWFENFERSAILDKMVDSNDSFQTGDVLEPINANLGSWRVLASRLLLCQPNLT